MHWLRRLYVSARDCLSVRVRRERAVERAREAEEVTQLEARRRFIADLLADDYDERPRMGGHR